jgi:hypothetical protein
MKQITKSDTSIITSYESKAMQKKMRDESYSAEDKLNIDDGIYYTTTTFYDGTIYTCRKTDVELTAKELKINDRLHKQLRYENAVKFTDGKASDKYWCDNVKKLNRDKITLKEKKNFIAYLKGMVSYYKEHYKEEKDKQALELADANEASYKVMKKLNYKFDKGKMREELYYINDCFFSSSWENYEEAHKKTYNKLTDREGHTWQK